MGCYVLPGRPLPFTNKEAPLHGMYTYDRNYLHFSVIKNDYEAEYYLVDWDNVTVAVDPQKRGYLLVKLVGKTFLIFDPDYSSAVILAPNESDSEKWRTWLINRKAKRNDPIYVPRRFVP
ncbi:MAG: hypothetical protein HYT03_02525 [Candidatus Harrisonbacteria bacterium]|nr:hypothetical protein [Candidatus Harrisonbacteria bacterium]